MPVFTIETFRGAPRTVEVGYDRLPAQIVQRFAAAGDKDARAFLAAQKPAKPKRPA